jgi:peptidoglycan-associated lipoprotein
MSNFNSPVWLGPSLLVVGTLAWTSAGALAHAQVQAPPTVEVSLDDPVPRTDPVEAVAPIEVAPAPQPEPKPAPQQIAEPCAPVVELTFANGGATVDRSDDLRRIVAAAAEFPDHKLVVEGYASAAGAAATNLQLSHRRARRAKRKLVAAGVEAGRITVQAFGEYRPNVDGDEARDRRVIVKIEGVATCPDQAAEE